MTTMAKAFRIQKAAIWNFLDCLGGEMTVAAVCGEIPPFAKNHLSVHPQGMEDKIGSALAS